MRAHQHFHCVLNFLWQRNVKQPCGGVQKGDLAELEELRSTFAMEGAV